MHPHYLFCILFLHRNKGKASRVAKLSKAEARNVEGGPEDLLSFEVKNEEKTER